MLSQQAIFKIDERLAKENKYYADQRQQSEIALTNLLVRKLSELNLLALTKLPLSSSQRGIRKEDFLYVCLPGVPPFEDEFKNLQLPGQTFYFPFACFEKGLTEEQQRIVPTEFEEQAKVLHVRLSQMSPAKPIVFVYHSFGSYTLAAYCRLFKNERVIGLIDAGGVPIRFYEAIKETFRSEYGISLEYIQQNLDSLYTVLTERNKKSGITQHQSKSQVFGLYRCYKSGRGFQEIFEDLRKLPNVLKCFIFGRKDIVFPEDKINEKVAFYSYKNKFEPSYQLQLEKTYERFFGTKSENVQERFVYSIEGGYHSIHMQKKYKDIVAAIVHRYLTFLEQVHSQEAPKM